MFLRVVIPLILFLSQSAFAICMTEQDASLYNCIPIRDSESVEICQEKYGNEYKAYLITTTCSKELAYSLRDEKLPEQSEADESTTPATCLSFEKGQKHNCQLWDYEPAYAYCSENYGDQFLPHVTSKTCSIELADNEYGYHAPDELTRDLDPMLAEAEAIMQMIDRQDLKQSLAGYISNRPIIGNEFYTDIMKGLLSRLEKIKVEITERSKLKIKFDGNHISEFLLFNIRYLNLVNRVHKVYAYVAHRNHKSIRTYDFKHFDFLNLKIKKVYALEILAKMNLKVKNLRDDMIEFSQSEQNKQIFEYESIAEPETKVDYAKLVSFLGVRENLNNIWAVDRLFPQNLLTEKINRCNAFLSFRTNSRNKLISTVPTVKENQEYDVFYNDYLAREEDLINSTQEITLIDMDLQESLFGFVQKNKNLKEYIVSGLYENTDEALKVHLAEDVKLLIEAEKEDWNQFSTHHFKTIVMPGDGVLNKNIIIDEIIQSAYKRRLKTLKNTFSAIYVWLDDKTHDEISSELESIINSKYKTNFQKNLRNKLLIALEDFNHTRKLAIKNKEQKIEETLEAAIVGARAGKALALLEDKKVLEKPFNPSTFQELTILFEHKIAKDFQDIQLTLNKDEKLAGILAEFFNKVGKKFNEEFMQITGMNVVEHSGTRDERERALYSALFSIAREYYLENKFEITQMAQIPEAVLLAREKEREEMTKNPYVVQVYRDGTPVAMHINQFYAALQHDMNIQIPRRDIVMRSGKIMGIEQLTELKDRDIPDMITDGTFDRPRSYISQDGEIRYAHLYPEIEFSSLRRLYIQSMRFTKQEIAESQKIKRENKKAADEYEEEKYEDVDIIKTSKKLFARVFELFQIPMGSIANNKSPLNFRMTREDQKTLASNELAQVYSSAPILRNEIETVEEVTELVIPTHAMMASMPYEMTYHAKVKRPLLHKIGLQAYDDHTNELDKKQARAFIAKTLVQARENVKEKFNHFCQSNYLNYKKDENFKKAFKASVFLRQKLMSPIGATPFIAKRIKNFDDEVTRDIRSWGEAVTHDYIEPALLWIGAAAIIAVGIVMIIGTWGAATPGAMTGIAGYLSLFLAIEFYVSFPLVAASLYTRINTQFIEVPEQLKFQESLAHSQVDFAKIADYDQIEEQRKSNRVSSYWTIGLMPLDLLYGGMIVRQVRSSMGYTGVKAYQKLTGMKLRKYSSPPKSMRLNRRFRDLRREHGILKGAKLKIHDSYSNLRMRLPRYQVIPEDMIRTKALRVGLAARFKSLRIHNKPWVILDEVVGYNNRIKDRLTTYKNYVVQEGKMIDKVVLGKGLKASEVMEHGLKNTKFGYTISSTMKAIKELRLRDYIKKYSSEIQNLKIAQAKLVQNKISKFDGLIQKIEDFKKLRQADEVIITGNTELTDDFLRMLSDDEIMLLEKISKDKFFMKEWFTGRQAGHLRDFRETFKLYQKVLQSVRPMTYLYGHTGEEFKTQAHEAMNFLSKEGRSQYTFHSDSEDIVNFYESMIRQNAFDDEASRLIREDLEKQISDLFILDSRGNRIYH